ncbi:MAG: sulfite exporter TauE/SafE family protein [Candidatus Electrothrix sp. AR4]|nr:sulfite exporter TauE/SafE family protein [Candidatus Electrothrix sp. AR4]
MYFPTANIDIQPWLPPLVAFGISFCTSMGGISGAFLLLPFQVSYLGFDTPSVSATNHIFNLIAIPSGVYRYIREGRMVWPLTWAVILGTLPGVLVGAVIRTRYLLDPTSFKHFIALVLLYIGIRLLKNTLKTTQDQIENNHPVEENDIVDNTWFNIKSLGFSFRKQVYQVPTQPVMLLSLTVGLIGGIYGIGGGALIAPFFVSFFGLPIYTVAGAALMGTMITSFAGVLFFHIIAVFFPEAAIAPDWGLGLLFGLGGSAGMYCGARVQRFIPARLIQIILTCSILFIALRYLHII